MNFFVYIESWTQTLLVWYMLVLVMILVVVIFETVFIYSKFCHRLQLLGTDGSQMAAPSTLSLYAAGLLLRQISLLSLDLSF